MKYMQYTLSPDCNGGGTLIEVTRYIEDMQYMQYTLTPDFDGGGTLIASASKMWSGRQVSTPMSSACWLCKVLYIDAFY
jgi:hypothetical protein